MKLYLYNVDCTFDNSINCYSYKNYLLVVPFPLKKIKFNKYVYPIFVEEEGKLLFCEEKEQFRNVLIPVYTKKFPRHKIETVSREKFNESLLKAVERNRSVYAGNYFTYVEQFPAGVLGNCNLKIESGTIKNFTTTGLYPEKLLAEISGRKFNNSTYICTHDKLIFPYNNKTHGQVQTVIKGYNYLIYISRFEKAGEISPETKIYDLIINKKQLYESDFKISEVSKHYENKLKKLKYLTLI